MTTPILPLPDPGLSADASELDGDRPTTLPLFKVTRREGPEGTRWGLSCVTCAKAGLLWFRRCETPEAAWAVMASHQWPCPSEPAGAAEAEDCGAPS